MALGWLSQAELLKEMVAGSATFRTVVNALDATEAKDHISLYGAVEEYYPVPRAIICLENASFNNEGIGNWVQDGELEVTFEFDYDIPGNTREGINNSYIAFQNHLQSIIAEMAALNGTGEPIAGSTHINLSQIALNDPPQLRSVLESDLVDPESETQKAIWWASIRVTPYG